MKTPFLILVLTMASNLRKALEGEEHFFESIPKSDPSGGHSDGIISVSVDKEPGNLFLALHSTNLSIESDGLLIHPKGIKNASEDRIDISSGLLKNSKKRSQMETNMHFNGENSDLNLSLTLSSPAPSTKEESLNESVCSSSPSQRSCTSMKKKPIDSLKKTDSDDTLIVMGCQRCYLYVMVPKGDPKCPQCCNTSLLDIFRDNPAKKTRKN